MHRILTFLILFVSIQGFAQKKPVDHSVYDAWESVGSKQISANGVWTSFEILQQEGDAKLNLINLTNNTKIIVSRASKAQFTSDSKFAAFSIKPWYSDIRNAKIKKVKADDQTKDSLGITNLITNQTTKISRVKSFKIPEEGGSIIAYLMEKPLDTAKKSAPASNQAPRQNDSADDLLFADDVTAGPKNEGTDLIFKNLTTGVSKTIKYVVDYDFNKNGSQLIYTVSGPKKDTKAPVGVFIYNTATGTTKQLVNKRGNFKGFTFDESGDYLVFLGETDAEKKEIKDFRVYYNGLSLDSAQVLVDNDFPGIPKNWSISGDARLSFSKDAKRLFFGLAPTKTPKDTTIVDFEVAKLDIWGYKDETLQTQQLVNLARDSRKSYLATMDILSIDPTVVPLADLKVPNVSIINEGLSQYALGSSVDLEDQIASQWTGSGLTNYYLVDINTGSKKKIIEKLSGNASASPSGKFISYFDDRNGNWYTYEVATGKTTQLNAGLNISFANETNDVPDNANSYGIAGWLKDDKAVLINDRYDVWQFSPDGKQAPINITNGLGRNTKFTFRIKRFDFTERFIDPKADLYFDAVNNINKDAGLYFKSLNSKKDPVMVMMSANKYLGFVKAKDANRYVYDKSNYAVSPEIYTTTDFKTEVKLASTNPQQNQYIWGKAELVKWTTPKGFESEGVLYKPENFDPTKKYPMLVYFYEKVSQDLHGYIPPAPTPSRLNISYFVSNGYLVFTPDISYEIGYPGKSAEEFINSGVEYLKKNSWVDGSKIGIQGQSWGGYQVAHLITRTNMYAAAWAGAPVANMTSAYGGIRWDSGLNRQFQYEKTQSRIGATLWEKRDLYIENSPLFFLDKVNTPLAIMANDADGAVPWYQGIELFTGLRRLGKPVWMLNYNNEAHNLVQRQNRKDIQIREQQFFDHYLKGAKAPVWMTSGVPASQKGKTWGFELTDDKP